MDGFVTRTRALERRAMLNAKREPLLSAEWFAEVRRSIADLDSELSRARSDTPEAAEAARLIDRLSAVVANAEAQIRTNEALFEDLAAMGEQSEAFQRRDRRDGAPRGAPAGDHRGRHRPRLPIAAAGDPARGMTPPLSRCRETGYPAPIRREDWREMGYKIAVVGATGNVGREMLSILAEREFPADEVSRSPRANRSARGELWRRDAEGRRTSTPTISRARTWRCSPSARARRRSTRRRRPGPAAW